MQARTQQRITTPSIVKYGNGHTLANATSVRFLTLNIAHGRSNGFHQLLQKNTRLSDNLDEIAGLVSAEKIDVVAVQEADFEAVWSGELDQVDRIAQGAELNYSVHGRHVAQWRLIYGTAILSRFTLTDPLSVVFNASSVGRKGFVVSTLAWPTQPDLKVDVVSLHLDALSRQVRLRQIIELVGILQRRKRPLILMGDFNLSLRRDRVAERLLCKGLGLRGERLTERVMPTYPRMQRRLDYVLISAEFTFQSYRTLNVSLSDHLPIIADVALKSNPL